MAASEAAGLVGRLGKLYTPVVADVLDKLGYRDQSLRADIRPLDPSSKLAGVARTVEVVDVGGVIPEEPYRLEMEVVDALKGGDVLVVSRCEWSFWGELLSTAATARGASGIVIDGYTRDTPAILEMGFPVFARGVHPADSLGRMDVKAYDVPIQCGDVRVEGGDLVLADRDGVVVVPKGVAEEAIARAEEKVSGENLVRQALRDGMGVTEAFRKFGIL